MVESHEQTLKNAGFSDAQIAALANVFIEDETGHGLWTVIKFFKKNEFACKCGGKYCNGFPVDPDSNLVLMLDLVREKAGAPCTISSGVRCDTHNANVGGVRNSWHKKGKAADFKISGKTSEQTMALFNEYAEQIEELYAIDNSYVHMAVK